MLSHDCRGTALYCVSDNAVVPCSGAARHRCDCAASQAVAVSECAGAAQTSLVSFSAVALATAEVVTTVRKLKNRLLNMNSSVLRPTAPSGAVPSRPMMAANQGRTAGAEGAPHGLCSPAVGLRTATSRLAFLLRPAREAARQLWARAARRVVWHLCLRAA